MKQKSKNFLNGSSNYSEVNYLKTDVLKPILEMYNEYFSTLKKNTFDNVEHMIPNNGKKYYLFIIDKSIITSSPSNKYKILYFFPEQIETTDLLLKNTTSDFFTEIDYNYNINLKQSNYLFEGYLYGKNKKHYLITDILVVDSYPVKSNYSLRNNLINEMNLKMTDINGHISIDIHPVFEIDSLDDRSNQLFSIFKSNFKFDEIISKELITNTEKIQYKKLTNTSNQETKKITKSQYIDVYNVFHIETNNKEGLLYIKTIEDSKEMKNLFKEKNVIEIQCTFNMSFKKWQPIFT